MDSGNESSGSSAGHHAGGNPTSLLESRKGRGTHKQILFGSVRFWSVFYRNDSWEVGLAQRFNSPTDVPHTTLWTTHRRWQGKPCLLVERILHACPRRR